jgi:hypothetical protein
MSSESTGLGWPETADESTTDHLCPYRSVLDELRAQITDEISRVGSAAERAADNGRQASATALGGVAGGLLLARRLLNSLHPDGAGVDFPGASKNSEVQE